MVNLATGVVALGILLVLARAFIAADPHSLVRSIRYAVGGGLLALAALLSVSGRWGVGLALAAIGIQALSRGKIGPFDLGGGSRSAGSVSTVRSNWFEMRLDHDSGAMSGRVLKGEHLGELLDELGDDVLLKLAVDVAADSESAALLEAYLDRRMPGWREHVEGDGAAGPGGAADTGAMTDQQAYEILGLLPSATEAEIRAAHRRLMKRVHPDQGGSTFLAAKINQAKDWLLSKHS